MKKSIQDLTDRGLEVSIEHAIDQMKNWQAKPGMLYVYGQIAGYRQFIATLRAEKMRREVNP
tara:strand:+ start:137 stop:322 length:186 start_codon:yes stop_codon:yes gene_type:complete